MGGLGNDVGIETADVIIQIDQPSKIVIGIKICKSTQGIIWQDIALAFGVKFIALIFGAGGLATMWEAVFYRRSRSSFSYSKCSKIATNGMEIASG